MTSSLSVDDFCPLFLVAPDLAFDANSRRANGTTGLRFAARLLKDVRLP